MNDHNTSTPMIQASEAMIDARQAAYALHLPYYWFSDRKMRAGKRIPHYLLGGLVRFRLSELEAWSVQFGHPPTPAGTEGIDVSQNDTEV
jgi:hypothetical protein